MSTATASEPTETKTVTFISKSANQVLTRKTTRHVDDGMGGKMVLGEEEWLQRQEDLNDTRIAHGKEPEEIDRTPWKVEFNHNVFSTDDPKLLEWLRAHWLFNNPRGFWEMGAAPDEPKPTLDQQMIAIADAAALANIEGLEELIDAENKTHKRPSVLQAAGAAVTRLRELDSEPGPGATSDTGSSPSTASS
jgi:hypothetical protein